MVNINKNKNLGGVRNSAIASQPCPSGHITADKREIKDFPKLLTAFRLNVEMGCTPVSIQLVKKQYLKLSVFSSV